MLLQNSEAHSHVLIDLVHLRSLDSRSAGTLLNWIRQARHQGIELSLCGLSSEVRAVAQLLGIHTLVMIYNSRSEAISALSALVSAAKGGSHAEHEHPTLNAAARTGTGAR
jgi:anti-anti-sigma regulatory factor